MIEVGIPKIGIQSYKIINKNYLEQSYAKLESAGFTYIDFNIAWQDIDVFEDLEVYREHKRVAESLGLAFGQVHAPRYFEYDVLNDTDKIILQYEHALKVCNILDCKYLVVHPIQLRNRVWSELGVELSLEEEWDINRDYFMCLGRLGAKYGVTVCIENLHTRYNNRIVDGICSSSDDIVNMIEEVERIVGYECIGACFDTGHANALRRNLHKEVLRLGRHLRVLHLHDNDGTDDQHQIPYTFCNAPFGACSTDWSGFLLALRRIGFSGVYSFEPTKVLRQTPETLLPALLKYLYSIGEHWSNIVNFEALLKEYADKQIILFGSGKMFDVYMKEFGEKFPPAFIVDNNSQLWNTDKNGIEIKNPDDILLIDKHNRIVVICSRFFQEMSEQLENIGVTEYILSEEILRMNG